MPKTSEYEESESEETPTTLIDYVKNNKITIVIIVAVLVGLVWWFYFRKKGSKSTTPALGNGASTVSSGPTGQVQVNVTKTRGASNELF